MSLYAIKTEMMGLLEAFDQHGSASAEAEAAIRDHAAALIEAFDAKADDYAALVRVAETRAAARREESERLQKLAEDDESLAKRLRAAMLDAMQQTGRMKVDTPRFSLSVKCNGGKTPVEVTDDSIIPPEYRIPKVTYSLDKDTIRQRLEAGEAIPGVALGERGYRLDLR